jgi:glycosyltransferase involved in cell wall biosynthesis
VKVCFVLPTLRPSGGVAVVSAHAERLTARHGVQVDVAVAGALGEVVERSYDLAVCTWWETAAELWKLDAGRRVCLLQSFEQRFYDRDAPFERLSAEALLALPLDFIVVAEWMRDLLAELRPDARCRVVPPGIDKTVFGGARSARGGGPLEVLLEGQPNLPFKGMPEAVAAVLAMREPVRTTLVALDPDQAGDVQVDRVVGNLDPPGMAALYRRSHVLVKLSRVESLGLAPIEAFHCGLPCVVTPYTGHDAFARHGENAIVTGFDDIPGTAAWLDLLARDRGLLAKLSDGARATAAGWPDPDESTRLLHGALAEMGASEPPTGDDSLLLHTLALNTHLGRARLGRRAAATEEALTSAELLIRELSASRDECGRMLEDARAELTRIRASRAYRIGRVAKRAVGRR